MRKKIFVLMSIVVSGAILAGCATPPPEWAQDAQVTLRDVDAGAIYGVGKVDAGFGSEDVMLSTVNLRARSHLSQARLEYARDFFARFVETNEEWFETEEMEPLWADFDDAFKSHTRGGGHIERQWTDEAGRLNGEGTVYSLARQDLDVSFFQNLRNSFNETLEQHGEQVLKVEVETMLAELDAFIETAQENPFKALLPPEPEEPEIEIKEEEEKMTVKVEVVEEEEEEEEEERNDDETPEPEGLDNNN